MKTILEIVGDRRRAKECELVMKIPKKMLDSIVSVSITIMILLSFGVCLSGCPQEAIPIMAGVWCVSPTGNATYGTNWSTAFGSIQKAINAAAIAGGGEVWVAAGTYTETVILKQNVSIYGGFSGIENTRDARDWEGNVTVIDGKGRLRCITGANGAVVDGFIIRNGHAESGGGMYNYYASPVVSNCTFHGNEVTGGDNLYGEWVNGFGAGMYNVNSSPIVVDCIFSENGPGNGGYMMGGGMFNRNSSPTVTRCTFVENTASPWWGGGMANSNGSNPTIEDCIFDGNQAPTDSGGGMANLFSSFPSVNSCVFSGNTAGNRGGGIYNASSSSTVINSCSFLGNLAPIGAGVCNYDGSSASTATNCLFVNNMATDGGGVYDKCASVFLNCTFAANAATSAVASQGFGGAIFGNNRMTVTNCILWKDMANHYPEIYSSPVVTYSCVQGGYAGTGNIADNPLFLDMENGDCRLGADSPCIDTGIFREAHNEDILGVERPQGSGYDMGAYEYAESNR